MNTLILTTVTGDVDSTTAISALAKEKIRMQAHRYQRGSLSLLKRKSQPDVWVFRYYAEEAGHRVYKKKIVGTVIKFPKRKDAERAVSPVRVDVNEGAAFAPMNLEQLAAHYESVELPLKAHSTQEGYKNYLALHVIPKWREVFPLGHQKRRSRELAAHTQEARRQGGQPGDQNQDPQSDVRAVLSCDSL